MAIVTCERLPSRDAGAVADLLACVFSAADPPAVAMGLTEAEMRRFLGLLCPEAAKEGLTVVAREPETNQIAGVLLTEDFAAPPELDLHDISGKFLPILAMLQGLDEEYRNGRSIARGQCLHLLMLGVDPRFARRGIAQQLVTACIENGRQKGYTHAVTEATGVVSQHLFRRLGFVDRLRVRYEDYRYEGRAVFASIRDHEATILMDLMMAA